MFALGSTTPLYLQQSQTGGATVWYHDDGLGSVRTLTDNSANVKNNYVYNAFGVVVQQSGTVSNTHKYVGEQLDTNGMYYNRNRYYNTGTGRFTQQDSYGGSAYSPLSQNRFIYGGDNPTVYTDPSGYVQEGSDLGGGSGVSSGESKSFLDGLANTLELWENVQKKVLETALPTDHDDTAIYASEKPDFGDGIFWRFLRVAASADEAWGEPDAARNLRHYLNNTGTPLIVDASPMLRDMPRFKKATIDKLYQYQQDIDTKIANKYNGKPLIFAAVSTWSDFYPDGTDSSNWYHAVGGFHYAYGGVVTVTPASSAGKNPVVTISYALNTHDYYNWDPQKPAGFPGLEDKNLLHLHKVGYAQEYEWIGITPIQTLTYEFNNGLNIPNAKVPAAIGVTGTIFVSFQKWGVLTPTISHV
jgi:RHS repeat-associated protein